MSKENKGKKTAPPVQYRTEEQLKQEALQRAKLQAELEAKRKPKSAAEKKAENFWYHYKWAAIGGAVGLVLVAFLIRDLVFRTDPDYTIILVSQSYYPEEVLTDLETRLAQHAGDLNGDGKVTIAFDSITLTPATIEEARLYAEAELDENGMPILAEPEPAGEAEEEGLPDWNTSSGGMDYAVVMKLSAVVAAGSDYIYLMDDDCYWYLNRSSGDLGEYEVFERLDGRIPTAQGNRLELNNTALAESDYAALLDDLAFYCRHGAEGDSKKGQYYAACLELLESIAR